MTMSGELDRESGSRVWIERMKRKWYRSKGDGGRRRGRERAREGDGEGEDEGATGVIMDVEQSRESEKGH